MARRTAQSPSTVAARPKVVIVGAGFGGLACARKLRGEPVDVLLVDRHNYHLFTPLLYQVASSLLNPSEIAAPLRKIFRGARNVRFRRAEVIRVDLDGRAIETDGGESIGYDHLVLATGAATNYFGREDLAHRAFALKDLPDAIHLRNHVLETLEAAVDAPDDERSRLLTFCVVGGGPTGIEYAGALGELARLVLPDDYPELDRSDLRIMLVEAIDRVLPSFTPRLSRYATKELERLGVEVHTGTSVEGMDEGMLRTDRFEVATETIVWTAGVRPTHLAAQLPIALDAHRRVDVDDHLRVVGYEDAHAIGDMAAGRDRHGDELPMTSPPAMQAGRYVAKAILGREQAPFRYLDKGMLATIGRRSAVAEVRGIQFTGLVGWIVWLVVHLYYLIGFENRARVLLRWALYYLRYDRPIRAIIHPHERDRRR